MTTHDAAIEVLIASYNEAVGEADRINALLQSASRDEYAQLIAQEEMLFWRRLAVGAQLEKYADGPGGDAIWRRLKGEKRWEDWPDNA